MDTMPEEERRRRIAFVVEQFALMGGTPSECQQECRRLRTDSEYFAFWCADLSWVSVGKNEGALST